LAAREEEKSGRRKAFWANKPSKRQCRKQALAALYLLTM
jgi:hypothetical protein